MNQGTVERMKALRKIADETISHGQATSRQLEQVINEVDAPLHGAERSLQDAVAQLEAAIDVYQFHLDKINRLVNTTKGNPGLMQALQAMPYDDTLRAAIKQIDGHAAIFGKLQKSGSTPQEIVKLLRTHWPAYFGRIDGPHYRQDSFYRGGKDLGFWYRKQYQKMGSAQFTTPTLAGDVLGNEIMRAMKIPHEAEMQKAAGPVDEKSTRPSGSKKNGGGSKEPAKPKEKPEHPSRVAGRRPSRKRSKGKQTALTVSNAGAHQETSKDPIGDALRRALHSSTGAASRWDELWEKGATDDELAAAIATEWRGNPGHSEKGMYYQCRGTKVPLFLFGREGKTKIGGKDLIERVRGLLQIPYPIEIPAASIDAATPPAFDAPQRILFEALYNNPSATAIWPPIIARGATDPQIAEALTMAWGRDAQFSAHHPEGKYDVNLKKKRVILRVKGEANKQIIRTLEGDALIHQVRAVLKIPQHPLAPAQGKPKSNGHAAPNDPASIEAGTFATGA